MSRQPKSAQAPQDWHLAISQARSMASGCRKNPSRALGSFSRLSCFRVSLRHFSGLAGRGDGTWRADRRAVVGTLLNGTGLPPKSSPTLYVNVNGGNHHRALQVAYRSRRFVAARARARTEASRSQATAAALTASSGSAVGRSTLTAVSSGGVINWRSSRLTYPGRRLSASVMIASISTSARDGAGSSDGGERRDRGGFVMVRVSNSNPRRHVTPGSTCAANSHAEAELSGQSLPRYPHDAGELNHLSYTVAQSAPPRRCAIGVQDGGGATRRSGPTPSLDHLGGQDHAVRQDGDRADAADQADRGFLGLHRVSPDALGDTLGWTAP